MLTDSNYFRPDASFPPEGDSTRQANFLRNYWLYESTPRATAVLNQQNTEELENRLTPPPLDEDLPKYRINMFRKVSHFWKDLLFAFPPIVDTQAAESNTQIRRLVKKIMRVAPNVAINTSRYGTGVYLVRRDITGELRVESIDTTNWFPVVDPDDQERVLGDIIAVPYNEDPGSPDGLNPRGNRVRVSRFIVGEPITVQHFVLEATKLGAAVGPSIEGDVLRERAVATVVNGLEEDYYGESDYPDLEHPVAEMNRRFSGISTVLDDHTNPHIVGPESAFVRDADGNPVVDRKGQIFPITKDDHSLGVYALVWEAKLESNFEQLVQSYNTFFMLSSTSAAAMGLDEKGGASSGAALRKLLFPSFLKLISLRSTHEEAITQLIRAIYPNIQVSITWPEPFLDGTLEEASAEEVRMRSGLTTAAAAIARLDHLSAADADKIAEGALQNPNLDTGPPSPNSGSGTGSQRGQVGGE